MDSLPGITYYDIVNYLINTKSAYTMEELKSLKAMDAYNQCHSGWVKDVVTCMKNNRVLVMARVRHSQRMNETPLKPWVIASFDGVVESAHCDCMAGLGEVCSHVGALLFWVDGAYRANAKLTVTQKKAYWPVPSYVDKVPYAEIKDIDFTSAEVKKRQFECTLSGIRPPKRSALKLPEVQEPTVQEQNEFLQKMHMSAIKPAVLSVKSEFQNSYVPEILQDGKLPLTLETMRDEKFDSMDREKILAECMELYNKLAVTTDQIKNAEYITKEQSKCKEWYSLRYGRITASKVKSVCAGTVEKPAMSTVKSVCGTAKKFYSKATQWGCQHESMALASYTNDMATTHENVRVEKAGLFISKANPHLGASPDALVQCACCGEGVVEIKCPYCIKDKLIKGNEHVEFLTSEGQLKSGHRYMYQVQTQLLAAEKEYCDFVVWTEKECTVQRIVPDSNMQQEIVVKSKQYFLKVILPEITGNLISRQSVARTEPSPDIQAEPSGSNTALSDAGSTRVPENGSARVPDAGSARVPEDKSVLKPKSVNVKSASPSTSSSKTSDDHLIICVCQTPYNSDTDDVIGCDNENCPFGWFHFTCIGLKRVPKGSYFCTNCKSKQTKRQRKV